MRYRPFWALGPVVINLIILITVSLFLSNHQRFFFIWIFSFRFPCRASGSVQDIYIGTKKDINFLKLDNLQAFCDAMGFMYEFCKKGQCSQIEERFLQFPNSIFCMRYMTTCQVSDPMNKLMITVKSKKIKEGNSIILKISFPSDILKIAQEQLHKITEDWLEEAFSIGYNQEIIKLSEGAFIKGNGYIKMIFDYTGLVHFPFLELFLRLNTLPLEIRPISMSFS